MVFIAIGMYPKNNLLILLNCTSVGTVLCYWGVCLWGVLCYWDVGYNYYCVPMLVVGYNSVGGWSVYCARSPY